MSNTYNITFSLTGSGAQDPLSNIVARANGTEDIASGTTISNGGEVKEGSSLAFFVTPGTGCEVSHWITNGKVVHYTGKLFTVANLQRYEATNSLNVQAVLQPTDQTGGRHNPNSPRNTTNKGRMGINIHRDETIITGSGLNTTFSDAFMASVAPFGLIRFMDYTNTNNHHILQDWNAEEATLWGEVIALGNAANTDIWICIPANASDTYIRKLAELMLTHLNPHIAVYVEWGNEVWGFEAQRNVNKRMAQERGIPTDSRKLWDAHQVWWEWEDYFHFAQRTAEIAFIFRNVFNEDSRPIDANSRVRPVLTWQIIPNAFSPMLEWLNGTTHTPTHSDPKFRNPHEYIWAVGIAPYFTEPNSALASDMDAIHRHLLNSIERQRSDLQAIIDNASAAGLVGGAITYEGGPHNVGDGGVNLTARTAAQKHPLMVDLMNYYITNYWFALGGGLYTHYKQLGAAARWGYWGAKDDLSLAQFMTASKYVALKWICKQPRDTTVARPQVQAPPPFVNPILNSSFEGGNPAANWNLGKGWTIDNNESADGSNSLHFSSSTADFSQSEASTQFTLEPNMDYIFSFWHKGEAGYKVTIEGGGNENNVTAKYSSNWEEYLVPFNSGSGGEFYVKISCICNAGNVSTGNVSNQNDAWFDFFHIDENLIYNPSFEKGLDGWAHGLGWIGERNYEVTNTQAYHGGHSLKIFGKVTPDGLNSNQFMLRDNTSYRLVFYHKGSGNFNAPIDATNGAVNITTRQSEDWEKYESHFNTAGMDTLVGSIKTSTTAADISTYVDNFMLFENRVPISS